MLFRLCDLCGCSRYLKRSTTCAIGSNCVPGSTERSRGGLFFPQRCSLFLLFPVLLKNLAVPHNTREASSSGSLEETVVFFSRFIFLSFFSLLLSFSLLFFLFLLKKDIWSFFLLSFFSFLKFPFSSLSLFLSFYS